MTKTTGDYVVSRSKVVTLVVAGICFSVVSTGCLYRFSTRSYSRKVRYVKIGSEIKISVVRLGLCRIYLVTSCGGCVSSSVYSVIFHALTLFTYRRVLVGYWEVLIV